MNGITTCCKKNFFLYADNAYLFARLPFHFVIEYI